MTQHARSGIGVAMIGITRGRTYVDINGLTRAIRLGVAAELALLSAGVIAAKGSSAQGTTQQPMPPVVSPDTAKQGQVSTVTPQGMMTMCQKMMADNKATDARLQPLIAKMNAATGQAKVDAMAAVITELIAQRTAARDQRDQMAQNDDA